MSVLSVLLLLQILLKVGVQAALDDLVRLMDDMEALAQRFAIEVEFAYHRRCQSDVLKRCERKQFNGCRSALPANSTECPSIERGTSLHVQRCGDGKVCNGIVDLSNPVVRLPDSIDDDLNFTPRDPQVIESVCFGPLYDEWMFSAYTEINDKFRKIAGLDEVSSLYFGATDGSFRIFPGRPAPNCNYDPRKRSWYVDASSPPKAVVVVIDVSGYSKPEEFEHVKETARNFIEIMGGADRTNVVLMGAGSETIEIPRELRGEDSTDVMHQATTSLQEYLKTKIRQQESGGRPDTKAAFDVTFDIIKSTFHEHFVDCDVSIVLIAQDKSLVHLPEEYIRKRKDEIENQTTGRHLPFFGFITGNSELTARALAVECAIGAVFSSLDRARGASFAIGEALRVFHETFAFSLGANKMGTTGITSSWTDPYTFVNGDVIGTTVSYPVYDRRTSPPLFIGVVGMDVPMEALWETLKPQNEKREAEEQISARQGRRGCVSRSLNATDIEALRRKAGSRDASGSKLCPHENDASDLPILERSPCILSVSSPLPSNLWHNLDHEDLVDSYEERTCCSVGSTVGRRNHPGGEVCPNAIPSPTPAPLGDFEPSFASTKFELSVARTLFVVVLFIAIIVFAGVVWLVRNASKKNAVASSIAEGGDGDSQPQVPSTVEILEVKSTAQSTESDGDLFLTSNFARRSHLGDKDSPVRKACSLQVERD